MHMWWMCQQTLAGGHDVVICTGIYAQTPRMMYAKGCVSFRNNQYYGSWLDSEPRVVWGWPLYLIIPQPYQNPGWSGGDHCIWSYHNLTRTPGGLGVTIVSDHTTTIPEPRVVWGWPLYLIIPQPYQNPGWSGGDHCIWSYRNLTKWFLTLVELERGLSAAHYVCVVKSRETRVSLPCILEVKVKFVRCTWRPLDQPAVNWSLVYQGNSIWGLDIRDSLATMCGVPAVPGIVDLYTEGLASYD